MDSEGSDEASGGHSGGKSRTYALKDVRNLPEQDGKVRKEPPPQKGGTMSLW